MALSDLDNIKVLKSFIQQWGDMFEVVTIEQHLLKSWGSTKKGRRMKEPFFSPFCELSHLILGNTNHRENYFQGTWPLKEEKKHHNIGKKKVSWSNLNARLIAISWNDSLAHLRLIIWIARLLIFIYLSHIEVWKSTSL